MKKAIMGIFDVFRKSHNQKQDQSFYGYIKISNRLQKLIVSNKRGKWTKVIQECNKGIIKFPDCTVKLIKFRGKAYYEILKSAIAFFAPSNELMYFFNRSFDDYSTRIKEKPDCYNDLYARGSLHLIKGDIDSAKSDFAELIRLNKDYWDKNCDLLSVMDDTYNERIINAFHTNIFFDLQEARLNTNVGYKIDPIILNLIPVYNRPVVLRYINNTNIKMSRNYEFKMFELFMDYKKINSDYLNEYFNLKILDIVNMFELINYPIAKIDINKINDKVLENLWE